MEGFDNGSFDKDSFDNPSFDNSSWIHYKALSSLQHIYFAFGISGQSSSHKAIGYTGYNLSIYI